MNANSLFKSTVVSEPDRPAQDEWGIFDPQQAGTAAVARTLREDPAPAASSAPRVAAKTDSSRHCRFCTETLLPGARQCPLCLREVGSRLPETPEKPMAARVPTPPLAGPTPLAATTPLAGAMSMPDSSPLSRPMPVSDMTPLSGNAPFPGLASVPRREQVPFGAVYTLETPAVCPECDKEIGSIQVLRVLRTQVSFTSTLPRKAYVIACPECRRLLSAGVSGIL
jgi:hypothetical protein